MFILTRTVKEISPSTFISHQALTHGTVVLIVVVVTVPPVKPPLRPWSTKAVIHYTSWSFTSRHRPLGVMHRMFLRWRLRQRAPPRAESLALIHHELCHGYFISHFADMMSHYSNAAGLVAVAALHERPHWKVKILVVKCILSVGRTFGELVLSVLMVGLQGEAELGGS